MNNPLTLLSLIGSEKEQDIQQLLQYIDTAPLAIDHWKVLKSIYKHYEAHPHLAILKAIIHKLDVAHINDIQGRYPSRPTLKYMKRRARRFMQNLADEATYAELALHLIHKTKGQDSLDPEAQWILFDVILGNSRRVTHISHGYGKIDFDGLKYHHNQVEAGKDIWKNYLAQLTPLLQEKYPWQIHEFIVKTLFQNKQAVPSLPSDTLDTFFDAPSNLLHYFAKKQNQERLQRQEKLSLKGWACLLAYSHQAEWQALEPHFSSLLNEKADWKRDFTTHLYINITKNLPEKGFYQKQKRVLSFIGDNLVDFVPAYKVYAIAKRLFDSQEMSLANLALAGAKSAQPHEIQTWIEAAENASQAVLNKLMDMMKVALQGKQLNAYQVLPFIKHPDFTMASFGWQLAEASLSDDYQIYYIWSSLSAYSNLTEGSKEYNTILYATISSHSVNLFIRYYSKNNNHLQYLSQDTLSLLVKLSTGDLKEFFYKHFVKKFQENPIQNLSYPKLIYRCDF